MQVEQGKYGATKDVYFELFEVDGVDLRTDWTPAAADCQVSTDGGAYANSDNIAVVAPTGTGVYKVVLSASEMTGAVAIIKLVDAATKVFLDRTIKVETYGHASAQHAFDLDTASVAQTADHTAGIADIPTVAEFNARSIASASYFDPAADTVAQVTLCDTITTYTGNTKQTADHTAGIADVPTVAEFNARTLVAASYFDPAADTVAQVTLCDTVTTYTGNTKQTADHTAGIAAIPTAVENRQEMDANSTRLDADISSRGTADPGDAMNLAADAIKAVSYDESTAFPVIAADTGATEIARTGADADTLETLSDQIDGVSAGDATEAKQDTMIAKLLAYFRLALRSDAGPTTDDATELTAINADSGSGGGDYDATNAQESLKDTLAPANEYDTQLDANMSTRAPAGEYDTELDANMSTRAPAGEYDTQLDANMSTRGTADPGDEMALINDAITAAKYNESDAFPVASADTGATEIARTGADADTLETLSDQIDGISSGATPNMLLDAEIATVGSQTSFTLATGSDEDDAYNDQAIVLYDDSNSDYPSVRVVNSYAGATKTVVIDSAPDFTVGTDDSVKIFVTAPGTVAPTAAQNRTEMDSNSTQLAAIVEDTGTTLENRQVAILADVTGINGDVMRGTDGANTAVPDVAGTAAGLHTTTDAILEHADYGLAKLVRSTTPANTLDIANGAAEGDLRQIKGVSIDGDPGQLSAGFGYFYDVAIPLFNIGAALATTSQVNTFHVDTRTVVTSAHSTTDGLVNGLNDFDASATPVEVLATGGTAGKNAEELIDGVWDELLTGALHNVPTSAGRRVRQTDLGQAIADEGTAQAGGNDTITLASTAESTTDDLYHEALCFIAAGTGMGQVRFILSYIAATRVATVHVDWEINPDNTSEYVIYGNAASNLHAIQDEIQSVTDLKDFVDAGYDPVTNKVQGVVLVDILDGHTAQTADHTAGIAAVPTLAEFVTVDTGETVAVAGSVAKIAQGSAGGNVTVGDLTQAALAQFVTDDTGETTATSGSVAEIAQGSGGGSVSVSVKPTATIEVDCNG